MGRVARGLGVVLVLAVPVAGIVWWKSTLQRPPAPTPRRVPGPAWQPPPQYRGEPQDGVTLEQGQARDVRRFRHLALHVPAGEAPSAELAPGEFTATFRGALVVPTRDRYRFTFVGTGTLELRVGEAELLQAGGPRTSAPVRLRKGEQPFVLRYASPPEGDATLRVYWESGEFAREPIPERFLQHTDSPSLQQAEERRRGAELAVQHRCGACHHGAPAAAPAPSLAAAGARLRTEWLARWIADPRAVRPGASMPAVLPAATRQAEARDIAAFLATLGKAKAPVAFTGEERAAGGRAFASLGCIACHTLPGRFALATAAGRTPLEDLAGKWHPAALVDYLREPARDYPGNPMPDFGLNEAAARGLAAFLLAGSSPAPAPQGDPRRGAELVARRGCAACHGIGVQNTLRAPREAIAPDGVVDCAAADYALADGARSALRAFLARPDRGPAAPVEVLAAAVERACHACHDWGGRTALLGRVHGEVHALLPDGGGLRLPPALTFAGSRLQTAWLERFLGGATDPAPRPWLSTRMPAFALPPAVLARGLAFDEGYPPTGGEPSPLDGMVADETTLGAEPRVGSVAAAELQGLGEKLLLEGSGFACIQCHPIGSRPAVAVFEAPGVDLALAPQRLRKEYFHRFARDPARLDPATKMTRFADRAGKTGLTDILGGDAAAQFEAIWRHLEAARR